MLGAAPVFIERLSLTVDGVGQAWVPMLDGAGRSIDEEGELCLCL